MSAEKLASAFEPLLEVVDFLLDMVLSGIFLFKKKFSLATVYNSEG